MLDAASLPARKDWMSVLAKAPAAALQARVANLSCLPGFEWLRPPEFGAVMVRGRTGGTGAPFNMGEMTVTRCSLRLETGEVGHAYVPGRDRTKAELAAICDALMQGRRSQEINRAVIAPLAAAHQSEKRERAGKADGTRVDFFTLVRGES